MCTATVVDLITFLGLKDKPRYRYKVDKAQRYICIDYLPTTAPPTLPPTTPPAPTTRPPAPTTTPLQGCACLGDTEPGDKLQCCWSLSRIIRTLRRESKFTFSNAFNC